MANLPVKRFFQNLYYAKTAFKTHECYRKLVNGVLSCYYQPQRTKTDKVPSNDSIINKSDSSDEESSDNRWKSELAWLSKAMEPAFQLCRWALPTGNGVGNKTPSTTRSVSEIIADIQRSKIGIEGWSLSDVTVGLYLIYLRQASLNPFEDIKGVQISSESVVQELIYHTELAKGCYKDSATGLAKNSMLRENNVLKFIKSSSVMRPGYYIGVDPRKKLVIFGIRGTHTVYDLITDVVSSSDKETTGEGYSTHFGTAEAARWFLTHEIDTIRKCLKKHEGYRLKLVGHSLGGATASLLAIMLRKKSTEQLGFSPDIVSAVGYATPPCVSRELSESCSNFVTTVVMQDDIIPRLSAASIARLRNEIVHTDWMSVIEKEDWKNVIDLLTNAKQFMSSVQDVARKLADYYAKFGDKKDSSELLTQKESPSHDAIESTSKIAAESQSTPVNKKVSCSVPEELFVPGAVYFLKRNIDMYSNGENERCSEYFTLWKRNPGEHFQRIVLSSNLLTDHKCISHYYALRDVLKGLPGSGESNENSLR